MKKLLLASMLLTAFTSQAAIIISESGDQLYCAKYATRYAPKDAVRALSIGLFCGVSTTTSLPTILLEGQEMDVMSDEASLRLIAEASGNAEAVLSAKIASELNTSVEVVFSVINEMSASNEEVSVSNVLSKFQQ